MNYGYARVSTDEQNLDFQMDALEKYGCSKIYCEKISGRITKRTELDRLMLKIKKGDSLVVWKLDRLGRTTKQLIELTTELKNRNVNFISLQDSIDTTTPLGKFYFTVMAGLAEMEVDMIRERTVAGLAAARKRGRIGGRPKISKKTVTDIFLLADKKKMNGREIAKIVNVSPTSVYRYLRQRETDKTELTF